MERQAGVGDELQVVGVLGRQQGGRAVGDRDDAQFQQFGHGGAAGQVAHLELVAGRGAVRAAAVVAKAVAFLTDSGFLQRTGDENGGSFRTTARYQLQVRDMAGSAALTELLDLGIVPVSDGTATLVPPPEGDDLDLAADAGLPFHA